MNSNAWPDPSAPSLAPQASPEARPVPAGEVVLRLLQEADLSAYKALRDAMLERHDQAFTSDAATERARPADSYRVRLHRQAGGQALFSLGAWLDGQLVGALTCEHEGRRKVQHLAHLVGMMVADGQQGRGIGRALLQQALALLRRDARLEQLTLSVTASNRAAVGLYRSLGFSRYGQLKRALRLEDGRYLDKDLMSISLQPEPELAPEPGPPKA